MGGAFEGSSKEVLTRHVVTIQSVEVSLIVYLEIAKKCFFTSIHINIDLLI